MKDEMAELLNHKSYFKLNSLKYHKHQILQAA